MRAEVPVLLLLLALNSVAWASDRLGRLLTSPEERRLIAANLEGPAEEARESRLVRFDGVMEVEQGRLAVWVNGRRFDQLNQLERQGMVLVNRETEPLNLVVLGEDGVLHRLLPGQAFDRTAGRVLESWEVSKVEVAERKTVEQEGKTDDEELGSRQATEKLLLQLAQALAQEAGTRKNAESGEAEPGR